MTTLGPGLQLLTADECAGCCIAIQDKSNPLHTAWPSYFSLYSCDGIKEWYQKLASDEYLRRFQVLITYKDPVKHSDSIPIVVDSRIHCTHSIVAMGFSIPFFWKTLDEDRETPAALEKGSTSWFKTSSTLPPTGWDGIFELGISQHLDANMLRKGSQSPRPPNAVSALSIMVQPQYRSQGLAEAIITKMKSLVETDPALHALVVPVRPTRKSDFKHIAFTDYLQWTKAEGPRPAITKAPGSGAMPKADASRLFGKGSADSLLFEAFNNGHDEPFDPWIRKHLSLGAKMIKIAPQSSMISATGEEWDRVAGDLGKSERARALGELTPANKQQDCYIDLLHVPGTLMPIRYHPSSNIGVYIEPNIWMRHI